MLKRMMMVGLALVLAAPLRAQPAPIAPAAIQSQTGVMTLDDAVALALKNNELIGQSEVAVRKSRARVAEITANGLPQVKISGTVLRQKEVDVQFGGNNIVLNPATSKSSSAVATQLLDVWGEVRRARRVASLTQSIAELSVLRSKSEVIYQTRNAYYNVLRAQGAVDAAQAGVTDAEEQLKLAQAFVTAGTSPEFDVTRARVTLADRQQSLIAATDGVSLAGAALNNVLGRDVNTALNLAPITESPSREVDIDAQTNKALETRPEIVQADLGIRANQEIVSLQRLGNLPTVALSGVYNYNFTASGLSTEKANWNYGVNVSWPLFDGGSTRAKVSEAMADVKTAELQRQQLHRGVALEVRQAGLRVQETADRFDVADKAVGLAQEALRLAKVRYQNGVATQLEVTDSETALVAALNNRNNALYDHLAARAAFDASVMGRLQAG